MDKITQDFKFASLYSAPYSKWLSTVYEAVPDVTVASVNDWYSYSPNTTYVSVTVPEDIAMLLKLQFGGHLVERPAIHPKDVEKESFNNGMAKMKILKKRMDISNNIWYDYKNNCKEEGIILKQYYDILNKNNYE